MNRIIIACAALSVAAAAVVPEDAQAQIVNYVSNNDGTGNYNFRFETSNGISREETGEVINPGQADQYIKVYGWYSYLDTNGEVVNVIYNADKDGYHIEAGEPVGSVVGILTPISANLPSGVVATLLGK
ncbi:endocuticle structural glycoprotein SgAbd-5-like isoform X1 [Spodoptera litura]|uniref:Endocuticle structural glycoprotein SgAbd-5-like isoform X1 n=1 Tax=Spodoptera litura TaxID=69820 RepID=A0A9J7IKR7_SPOLT|nr:endocuticle structural glycoprotein SgAbd-5-like isoform X1 [Spodoptera litura]